MHDLRRVEQYLTDEAALLATSVLVSTLLQLSFQESVQSQHAQTAVYSIETG